MTSTTKPAAAAQPKPAGFGSVLSSEWAKIITVRSTFWTMLAGIVVTVGLSVLLSWAFVASWEQLSPTDRAAFDPAPYGLVGTNFGMVAFAVLGVLVITGEYATGMIRTSLTAMPNRVLVMAAKALVLTVIGLIVGLIASFAAFQLSQLFYDTKDVGTSLSEPGVLRAVIGGGLYLTVIALFGLGIGALLRHTAGAVTVALAVLFVLPIVGSFLPGTWGDWVAKLLPSNAGGAIMTVRPVENQLDPWVGFGVFTAYAVVLLIIATALFHRRDA